MNRSLASHRGMTLLEVVVATGTASILMGIAVMLLGTMLRAERTVRDESASRGRLGALSQQFRRDVRECQELPALDDPRQPVSELRLDLAQDKVAIWRFSPGKVVRTVESQDGYAARVMFHVDKNLIFHLGLDESPEPRLLRLTAAARDASAASPLVGWQVAAFPGRDARLVSSPLEE